MDAGAEVAVELALAGEVVAWALAGAALGTISGLVPGLHANNFALLLAGVPPSVPVTMAVTAVYPTVRENLTLVLGVIAICLVVSEYGWRARIGAILSFSLAAGLGMATLDLEPAAPLDGGGMLAPLFAGLFGAPVLIDAIRGGGVPPQDDRTVTMGRPLLGVTALAGALAGAIVGYIPGISAAIAAVAVLLVIPSGTDDRSYIVATSGVDTANTIFASSAKRRKQWR